SGAAHAASQPVPAGDMKGPTVPEGTSMLIADGPRVRARSAIADTGASAVARRPPSQPSRLEWQSRHDSDKNQIRMVGHPSGDTYRVVRVTPPCVNKPAGARDVLYKRRP